MLCLRSLRGFSKQSKSPMIPGVPVVSVAPKIMGEVGLSSMKLSVPPVTSSLVPAESWLSRGKFLPPPHSPTDDFYKIFQNNQAWVARKKQEDPEYFKKMATGQSPRYLLLGCSDSRVEASTLAGLEPGSMFIHRNIANMCVASDLNFLSVLQYGVEFLKVQDIIVLGHYGCGGVIASLENTDLGLVENWLRNLRDIQRIHADELAAIPKKEDRVRRLVELNVYEQCLNIYKTGIVQQSVRKNGFPRVHGLVYELSDGLLKQLDIDFEGFIEKHQHIYAIGKNRKREVVTPSTTPKL